MIQDFIEAQKAKMRELRAEMNKVLDETRDRLAGEKMSPMAITISMNSVYAASWPKWMKSTGLKRAEAEPDDDTFPCPKCKTGRMVDLGDGRSGYCPDCEATIFL